MPIEYKPKVKFFVTTKADLATDKVNEWLEEHENEIDVVSFQPFMSYAAFGGEKRPHDVGGYMIGCMISYLEIPNKEHKDEEFIVDEPLTYGMNFSEEQ